LILTIFSGFFKRREWKAVIDCLKFLSEGDMEKRKSVISEGKTEPIKASFQCMDAIEISLHIEKEGLFFYESAGKKIQNPKVREMFSSLANEEREHIQTLQEKGKFLQPAIASRTRSKAHVQQFVGEELRGKIFPDLKDPATQNIESDKQALQMGIESEKRSIEILQGLLEKEKKLDVKAIFSHLLVEEKKHLSLLENLKEQI
jgi:rubrerythrin